MLKFKKHIILSVIPILTIIFFPYFSYSQDDIDVALDNLTQQINQYMTAQKKTKIAIIPFSDLQKQGTTVLGSYLAEELTTNLFMTGKFKIVERSLLKQVIDELKLSQTGVVDPNSAKELGRMAGVDAIVTGTTVDLGSYIAINCRLIETETGEVFAAAKAKIKKDSSILKIMGEITEAKKTKEKIKEPEVEEEKEKIIHFKNKSFYGKFKYESICHVKLISVKIFPERKTEFNLLYKNISDNEISIWVDPKFYRGSETYISDNLGNRYPLLSLSGVPERTGILKLPPGISIRILFTFPSLREEVNVISFVSTHGFYTKLPSRISLARETKNVIFRNIRLR